MKRETEILIIGGGAIGICTAYYLSEQGRKATVTDSAEICAGSSYGNAGLVVPSHSVPLAAPGMVAKGIKWMFDPESPFYIKPRLDPDLISWLWKYNRACNEDRMRKAMPVIRDMTLASLSLFDELAGIDGLEFGYEKKGILTVFKTQKGFKEAIEEARLQQEYGIETDVLSSDEILQLEQDLRIEAIGGVYHFRDAHLIPHRFVQNLAKHIKNKGVDILTDTEVIGFETSGRRVKTAKTTRGEIAADEIVLAAGAWSPLISRDLNLKLLMQPAKGYSITFNKPRICPARPVTMGEVKVVATPMGDTLRFAGTLELAGLDLSINRRRVQAILKRVPQYIPDLDPAALELIEIWRGLRPCTPDGLPYLGRPRAYDNLIVATGHAMIGLSLAPITGRLVSQLAAREEPQTDISALGIERFN